MYRFYTEFCEVLVSSKMTVNFPRFFFMFIQKERWAYFVSYTPCLTLKQM